MRVELTEAIAQKKKAYAAAKNKAQATRPGGVAEAARKLDKPFDKG